MSAPDNTVDGMKEKPTLDLDPRHIEMPHPQPKNLNRAMELDFVRGIAILMVLNLHFNNDWPVTEMGLHVYGWLGVDLFFVLSGFLVGGLLMKELKRTGRVDGWRFLRRRALKIWPPYYFYILFIVVTHAHPLNTFLIQNLLHIQNYTGTSLAQTWTLAVEEHFYLLLTLFMMLAFYLRLKPMQIIVILGFFWEVEILLNDFISYYGIPHAIRATHLNLSPLLLGVILAGLLNYRPAAFAWLQERRALLLTIVIGGMACIIFANNGSATDLICASFMLLCFRTKPNPNRGWLYRLIALIGIYSYGIYLWHLAARTGLDRVAEHLPASAAWWLNVVLRIPVSIIAGIVMTKLIEFPFLKLRDHLIPAPVNSHLLPETKS